MTNAVPGQGRTALSKPNSAILQQTLSKNQLNRISELSNYIRRRQLTNALALLERRGLTGDLAIFLLVNLQNLEVGI